MKNKRSELASILRRLADYIDSYPDPELAPIFEQAARLMQTNSSSAKSRSSLREKPDAEEMMGIAAKLRALPTREAGDDFLSCGL